MNLDEYWQENKRFVVSVACGVVAFFVGTSVIESVYGQEVSATRTRIQRLKRDLAEPLFDANDLARAEEENEALVAAVGRLTSAAGFVPRPEFVLEPGAGSPSNQYLRALSQVKEDVLPRANRANLQVDTQLGMPKLSPTREAEIVRYLEALDLIETVVGMAIQARVDRIDKIQIRLDPGLNSRAGLDRIEETRVLFSMTGTSLALTRVLAWSQRRADGRALLIVENETVPARGKEDEVRLDVTFLIARLHDDGDAPEAEDAE